MHGNPNFHMTEFIEEKVDQYHLRQKIYLLIIYLSFAPH